MEPRDFLNLAGRLTKESTEPAELRTAISRAYYSAYNTGASLVRRLTGSFQPPQGRGYHTYLRDCLKCSNDSIVREVGQQLYAMSEQRADADYEMDAAQAKTAIENQNTADAIVQLAEKLVTRLETARNDARRRNAIQVALRNFVRTRGG